MADTKKRPPDLEAFVDQSVRASLAFADEPSGEDTEQAAKVRLLAQASLAFQAAKDLSIGDMGLDQYVADIAAGKGMPGGSNGGEPLALWLERTIQYLSHYNPYNPYEHEGREESFDIDAILDEDQPTFLADNGRTSS